MEIEKLSVGKMAKLNNISEQTLRLYDKIGLLKPAIVNKDTGYRYYSIEQSAILDAISYYKNVGFSLKEIEEILNKANYKNLTSLLHKKTTEIENEILRLQSCKNALIKNIEILNLYSNSPKTGETFLEHLNERKFIIYKSDRNYMGSGYNMYEYALREFKTYLQSKKFPMEYFSKIGTIVRKDYFIHSQLFSNEAFVIIDDSMDIQSKNIESVTIPAGTYLSLCCSGFENEKNYAISLLNEIKSKKYTVQGDYICEIIYEFPSEDESKREFFYKISVPIKVN